MICKSAPVLVFSLVLLILLDCRVVGGLVFQARATRRALQLQHHRRRSIILVQHPSLSFVGSGTNRSFRKIRTARTTITATTTNLLLRARTSSSNDSENDDTPSDDGSTDGVSDHQHQQQRQYAIEQITSNNRIMIWRRDPKRAAAFSVLMALSGAVLGPFLDSFHSAFGVLQYDAPLTAQLWAGGTGQPPALITAWWVPELFGLAGFLIGWLYILLDDWRWTNDSTTVPASRSCDSSDAAAAAAAAAAAGLTPSPPKILLGISFFTFQYWLSGALVSAGVDRTTILMVMSVAAASGWASLDRTWTGLWVSAATALGGPLIEVILLTLSRNDLFPGGTGYQYLDLGETGFFPLWIVPVYFLGGPANGNLARGYWTWLGRIMPASPNKAGADTAEDGVNTASDIAHLPGCKVCSDTRRVPCPNCDGIGTYQAMGGQTVTCNACRGRGFVICRACFSFYNEDPNDIEAIRELMSRMPD